MCKEWMIGMKSHFHINFLYYLSGWRPTPTETAGNGRPSSFQQEYIMFEEFKKIPLTMKPNRCDFPVNYINDRDKFNKIYNFIYSLNWEKFVWTDKNYVSHKNLPLPSYNWRKMGNGIDLVVLCIEGCFIIRYMMNKYVNINNGGAQQKCVNPRYAFSTFKSICKKFNIDLDTYKIDNGKEVKEQIEKTMIHMAENGLTGSNKVFIANHIDINSAWPAALTRLHPEFKGPIEYIYQKKEEESKKGVDSSQNIYKAILNYSIGWMQSIDHCGAQWAHLSRDAINENNRYMRELSQILTDSGRYVLAYNTDGIWYVGDLYHGEGEGSGLGQWENDHIDCKIRFKSAGSYEYIENGIYKPVQRGLTKLDKIKPREVWEWGDIFTEEADEIEKYLFIEGKGVIPEEKKYEF